MQISFLKKGVLIFILFVFTFLFVFISLGLAQEKRYFSKGEADEILRNKGYKGLEIPEEQKKEPFEPKDFRILLNEGARRPSNLSDGEMASYLKEEWGVVLPEKIDKKEFGNQLNNDPNIRSLLWLRENQPELTMPGSVPTPLKVSQPGVLGVLDVKDLSPEDKTMYEIHSVAAKVASGETTDVKEALGKAEEETKTEKKSDLGITPKEEVPTGGESILKEKVTPPPEVPGRVVGEVAEPIIPPLPTKPPPTTEQPPPIALTQPTPKKLSGGGSE